MFAANWKSGLASYIVYLGFTLVRFELEHAVIKKPGKNLVFLSYFN